MKKFFTLILIFSLSLFFFSSCQLKVPIKEMVDAYQSLKDARKIQAPRYAPDKFKKAEKLLLDSHSSCKKEDVKACRQQALQSLKESRAAMTKTWPLLAGDTLEKAEKELKACENLNAAVYAPQLHSTAAASLKDAAAFMEEKKYPVSHKSSLRSLAASREAKTKCLARVSELQKQVQVLETKLSALKAKSEEKKTVADIAKAEKSLAEASKAIETKNLKEASALIATATISINEIEKSLQRKKLTADIAALRSGADTLKRARGRDFAAPELEKLYAAIDEAALLIDKNDTAAAGEKIKEAESLLAAARKKTEAGIAGEKLQALTKRHGELSEKDSEETQKEKLDEAKALLAESDALIRKELYSDSLQKSLSAEAILNSVAVELEKALALKSSTDKEKKAEKQDEGRVYTVQYDPKNRDCLWRISLKVYKDARLWPRIYLANRQQIKDPDLIFPGQRFVIPPLKSGTDETANNSEKLPPEKEKTDEASKDKATDKTDNEETEVPSKETE